LSVIAGLAVAGVLIVGILGDFPGAGGRRLPNRCRWKPGGPDHRHTRSMHYGDETSVNLNIGTNKKSGVRLGRYDHCGLHRPHISRFCERGFASKPGLS
jgi:hypothetical protein